MIDFGQSALLPEYDQSISQQTANGQPVSPKALNNGNVTGDAATTTTTAGGGGVAP